MIVFTFFFFAREKNFSRVDTTGARAIKRDKCVMTACAAMTQQHQLGKKGHV